jgi:serine/threonine protein kinase
MGLNHSNIVQVLDLGHVHGRYFLVMEFVDGWDLGQIIARAVNAAFPIPPEIVLYIAAETCRALAYAHSRTRDGQPLALVHRDISPQNVLISEQGEVKLTDFGIAKAMGRRERTHQGVIKGKLAFMSPEQASGFVLDNRSDLFSLGTILYLLITGRRPFEAPTDMESIVRVRECRFTPPEEAKPGLHPEMAAIIQRAMQAKPADRFQSADDMLLAIENVQRTVYKPAGQTELKRWLADLQERDHLPSFGRTQTPRPISPLDAELDVGEGADVVFDQSDLVEVSEIMRGMQATIPVPTLPSDVIETIPAEPVGTAKTTMAPSSQIKHVQPSEPPGRRKAIAVVSLAGIALVAWLLLRRKAPEPERPVPAPLPKPPPKPPEPIPARPPEPKPTPKPAAVIDASPAPSPVDTKAADSHGPVLPVAVQEDEEDLLRNAEPDSSERVIGEDDGIKQHRLRPSPSVGSEPPAPLSVRIISVPEGAVVSIGKRVFGRAPINLRFRPGISYELTFVKKGYQSTNKRFTVTTRANQSVKAVLKQKPAAKPKKSLFRRIFGR